MSVGRALSLCLVLLCASCGASSVSLGSAAINTAIAGGVSAARRASGKCYTWCDEFSRCDEKSGYCVPLPCGGRCHAGESCVKLGNGEKCMVAVDGDNPANAAVPPGASPPANPNSPPQKPVPPKPPWMP